MSRNSSEEVIILRVKPVGEIHASVRMLGRSSGLLDAMAYGARSRRGSLRGRVVPFASGRCYLYTDPTKGSSKIVDLAVETYYPELRENIRKFYIATLWAEIVLASYAAGSEGEQVWNLLSPSLDLLASGEESGTDRINFQFLWHFIELLGTRPELPRALAGHYRYLSSEHRFSSVGSLEEAGEGDELLSAGSLAYLRGMEGRSLEEAAALRPTREQTRELKSFLFRLVQESSGRELRTIRSGRDIL
ncbi:MAG: DNA repair protein RecO [Alkalispirochaetaceae bacterium]